VHYDGQYVFYTTIIIHENYLYTTNISNTKQDMDTAHMYNIIYIFLVEVQTQKWQHISIYSIYPGILEHHQHY